MGRDPAAVGPTTSAAGRGRRLEDDELRPDVQGGVGDEFDGKLGKRPMSIVAAACAEHLPQRREIGRVETRSIGFPSSRPSGRRRCRRPCLRSGDDPAGVVGIDDAGTAVAHLPPDLQVFRTTSMRLTSWPGSRIWLEWMTGLGTAFRSVMPPPSGEEMPSTASSSPPVVSRMSWRTSRCRQLLVHRLEHAADVAVAEQPAPPASQLFRVRRLIGGELPDVSAAPRLP